jgi:plasmid maintenance system antidote protein VapI
VKKEKGQPVKRKIFQGIDTSPECWLNQQVHFEIWQAEKGQKKLNVQIVAVS